MPRYFFHIDDGAHLPDHEGHDLPSLKAAQAEALRSAGSILRDADHLIFDLASSWQMAVTDESHRLLFTLRFNADVPSGSIIFRPT
ncbi:DUF6894 family protein [Tianweitania sediminis]|jgi:hypothetical protein|uniref:DUF6894 domain-containing protein n=1 Tax=Tianweitania sediminis TaxID=1502156 RepID=A0A8J7UKH4_9HYPH|nr:hypothetical protein [Tianweitania sediminis]